MQEPRRGINQDDKVGTPVFLSTFILARQIGEMVVQLPLTPVLDGRRIVTLHVDRFCMMRFMHSLLNISFDPCSVPRTWI